MLLQGSIARTTLTTLLSRQIMFKTTANKTSFSTLLVEGYTLSFESFSVIFTVWKVVFAAVSDNWGLTLLLTDVLDAEHHEECKLLETRTSC